MKSDFFFRVTLTYKNGYLIFSPDHKLVEKTVATIEKKYPNVKDMASDEHFPLFVIDPYQLSGIFKKAFLESLPAAEEEMFRTSISERLLPTFEKLKNEKALVGKLKTNTNDAWKELIWENYSSL